MLTIFTDAAYDHEFKIATYCITTINSKGKKKWFIESIVDCEGSNEAEYAGICAAVKHAAQANDKSLIYCDSKSAIKRAEREIPKANFTLRHIKGHQFMKEGVTQTLEIRLQNWSDIQAHRVLQENVIDIRKTRAYNERVKGDLQHG